MGSPTLELLARVGAMDADETLWITQRKLQHDQLSPTEIVEWVTLNRLLWGLPGEEQ